MLKRFFALILALFLTTCTLILTNLTTVNAATGVPRINANPIISQEDVLVYTHNVLDYGAIADDNNDDTTAFQNAINDAYADGGGIVYAPAGKYKFTGNLVLKRKVTLRGEWRNPDDYRTAAGTILMPYANKDNESGDPFIKVSSNAVVKNLSIWYPEQSFSSVHAYPWTIADAEVDADDVFEHHGTAVLDITMYNSYKGISIGKGYGDYFNSHSTDSQIKNVYGTYLKTGVLVENEWNFAQFAGYYFSSKYWINSGLTGAPSASADQTTLKTYMRANLTGYISTGHIDGSMTYDINVEDANTGILSNSYWCKFGDVDLTNVNIGFKQTTNTGYYGGSMGLSLVGGNISVLPGTGHYGIYITGTYPLAVQGLTIGGDPKYGVYCDNEENNVNLMSVTFSNWSDCAVKVDGNSALIENCQFNNDDDHIYLGSNVKTASILGNTWTGGKQITNQSTGLVLIDDTALNLPELPSIATSYTLAPYRKPSSLTNFYNIEASPYNAAPGGTSDCTSAIQDALDDAYDAGGGTVFVPAGYWRVNGTLTIPTGVELRGISEAPGLSDNRGSTLFSYANKDDEDGTPFITMNANSGLNGISVYYPEMGSSLTVEYPWCVRGNGSDIYIRNFRPANAWKAIDLKTNKCDDFILVGVWGNPREIGISVGGGTTGGIMENCMFCWTGDSAESSGNMYPNASWRNTCPDYGTTAMPYEIGNASNIDMFQCVSFMPNGDRTNSNIEFLNDSNGPSNINAIQCGTDGAKGYIVYKGNNINLIDYQHTWYGSIVESTFSGTLNTFCEQLNASSVSGETKFIQVNGGTVNMVQGGILFCGTNPKEQIYLTGGTFNAVGIMSENAQTGNLVYAGSGITSASISGCATYGGVTAENYAGSNLTMAKNINLSYTTTKVDDASEPVIFSGNWTSDNYSLEYMQTRHYTNSTGAYAQLSFNGSFIKWIGDKDTNRGYADIYIDGSYDSTVDTYASSVSIQQVLYQKTGLSEGNHTIRVVCKGTKNASSSGYDISVDAFECVSASSSNIAIGATASASSTYTGYAAANINDGNNSTAMDAAQSWANSSSPSQWVELDFGKNRMFNKVELYTSTGYEIRDYQIQYWDGSSWTDVITAVTGNTQTHRTHSFAAVTGSKIRVVGNSGPDIQTYYVRVNELEVYNNIAIGATASAQSTYTGYAASHINDGNNSTVMDPAQSWANSSAPSQWIELDFGANKTFRRVDLYTSSGYEIRDYQIQYWNGSSWIDVIAAVTGNTQTHRTHTFAAVTGSKIRVVGNSGPNILTYYVRVNELEVYGY